MGQGPAACLWWCSVDRCHHFQQAKDSGPVSAHLAAHWSLAVDGFAPSLVYVWHVLPQLTVRLHGCTDLIGLTGTSFEWQCYQSSGNTLI